MPFHSPLTLSVPYASSNVLILNSVMGETCQQILCFMHSILIGFDVVNKAFFQVLRNSCTVLLYTSLAMYPSFAARTQYLFQVTCKYSCINICCLQSLVQNNGKKRRIFHETLVRGFSIFQTWQSCFLCLNYSRILERELIAKILI